MRPWALACLLAVGCDPRPAVNLAIVPSVDVPELTAFERVTLTVDRCDVAATAPAVVHTLDVSSGSRPELVVDAPPDVPLSFWLAAWRPCGAAECRREAPSAGVCVCDQGSPPAPQVIAFEGCTDFARFAEGSESTVSLSLSATQARARCPTPRAACP